ncbi:MAG: hypothetical protein M9900_11975 [Flavobacteriales bacterium]|nr:hypothetical protein [Flavobacteriales bacterium]
MKPVTAILLLGLLLGCGASKDTADPGANVNRTRPLMVYRTTQDMHDKVPVGLSEDRTHIISYPAPKDLAVGGKLLLPTKLMKGYWLDNKGVGLNTGFLKMTYAEYAALQEAPPLAEMEAMLLDTDPLTFLCDCGSSGTMADPVKEINALLRKGKLRDRCKVLK